jgi:hypothetical protein
MGLKQLLLSHWVCGNKLVGITRTDADIIDNFERGKQISDYLKEFPAKKYIVIDDLDLGISKASHPFIHVDGDVGLTDENVEEAIRLLS